jgi:hypothetical protein
MGTRVAGQAHAEQAHKAHASRRKGLCLEVPFETWLSACERSHELQPT